MARALRPARAEASRHAQMKEKQNRKKERAHQRIDDDISRAVFPAARFFLCPLGRKLGILGVLASAGVTAAIWGIVQVVNAQRTIALLDDHIKELVAEQKRLAQQLEDLD